MAEGSTYVTESGTYADQVVEMLVDLGYTHCFFVAGGNIMHLLNSVRTRMTCVPFVHEVSAGIAAEYFNEVAPPGGGRAFALVTAGPGLTNIITALAGAWLESRELLVIGGQVKSSDLSDGSIRQNGIQEVNGIALAKPVSKGTLQITKPAPLRGIAELIAFGLTPRKGPVFIEMCVDAQGAPRLQGIADALDLSSFSVPTKASSVETDSVIVAALKQASRPVLLIGGGVSYETARSCRGQLVQLGVPLMTTWNGFDRVPDDHPCFAGRPNTWGQRAANVLLAQSDCVIALGTRLGIQQTGFNWEQWGPRDGEGVVIQVDIDEAELRKGHPRVDMTVHADANEIVPRLAKARAGDLTEWWQHIRTVRKEISLLDPENTTSPGYLSPYDLIDQLSDTLTSSDVLVPASSGSGQFVPMEVFRSRAGQRVTTNKGLASMGYGLAAAIGAAASTARRVILVEGDGSFSQSVQELGTLALHRWPVKIFLLDNDGYASIRTTQRNYFGGAYLGCDSATGLGFPNWHALAGAFSIESAAVGPDGLTDPNVAALLSAPGPGIFVVAIDPDQTYYPKVTSRVVAGGSMTSNPIHLMSPPLTTDLAERVFKFRQDALS